MKTIYVLMSDEIMNLRSSPWPVGVGVESEEMAKKFPDPEHMYGDGKNAKDSYIEILVPENEEEMKELFARNLGEKTAKRMLNG